MEDESWFGWLEDLSVGLFALKKYIQKIYHDLER